MFVSLHWSLVSLLSRKEVRRIALAGLFLVILMVALTLTHPGHLLTLTPLPQPWPWD